MPQNGSEKRCLRDEAHQQGNFFRIKYQNKKSKTKLCLKKASSGHSRSRNTSGGEEKVAAGKTSHHGNQGTRRRLDLKKKLKISL